nr:hypothetical protein [Candidatus Sigynarchaeota archaeon]
MKRYYHNRWEGILKKETWLGFSFLMFSILLITGLTTDYDTPNRFFIFRNSTYDFFMFMFLAIGIFLTILCIMDRKKNQRWKIIDQRTCPACHVPLAGYACQSCGGFRCTVCETWNEKNEGRCKNCDAPLET